MIYYCNPPCQLICFHLKAVTTWLFCQLFDNILVCDTSLSFCYHCELHTDAQPKRRGPDRCPKWCPNLPTLYSYSGHWKCSWIQVPWAIWFQLSMYHVSPKTKKGATGPYSQVLPEYGWRNVSLSARPSVNELRSTERAKWGILSPGFGPCLLSYILVTKCVV